MRITSDTRRIIRLPGSIHGKLVIYVTVLTLDMLNETVESWIDDVHIHYANKNSQTTRS